MAATVNKTLVTNVDTAIADMDSALAALDTATDLVTAFENVIAAEQALDVALEAAMSHLVEITNDLRRRRTAAHLKVSQAMMKDIPQATATDASGGQV